MAVEMPLSIANRRTAPTSQEASAAPIRAAADQPVVARAAVQGGVAAPAVGRVLAAEAAQAVRRGMARDDVVRSRYVTHIFTAPHRGGGHRPAGIRGCAPPAGINAADARHQANALDRCPLPRHHPPMPVDPDLLAGYLLASLLLVVTPGPDMAFVLGQTLAGGARRGWAAMAGVYAGVSVHIGFAAAGVAALVAAHPALFTALRLAGAGYLAWIGIRALGAALRGGPAEARAAAAASLGAAFRQGFVTNLLNPKVGLFFLAFVPLFVDPARSPAWLQMLILGPMLPALALPFYALLIPGAARLAGRFRAASAGRWLDGAAGALFLGLGLRLLSGAPR